MATKLFMRRSLSSLVPANGMSEEVLRELPEGTTYKVVATCPRNLKHHQKYWVIIDKIFPHQSIYPTKDSLNDALKIALGYGTVIQLPDGRIMMQPGSISFAKMDQTDFDAFYKRAIELIVTKVLPGVAREDLLRELEEVLDLPHPEDKHIRNAG